MYVSEHFMRESYFFKSEKFSKLNSTQKKENQNKQQTKRRQASPAALLDSNRHTQNKLLIFK